MIPIIDTHEDEQDDFEENPFDFKRNLSSELPIMNASMLDAKFKSLIIEPTVLLTHKGSASGSPDSNDILL